MVFHILENMGLMPCKEQGSMVHNISISSPSDGQMRGARGFVVQLQLYTKTEVSKVLEPWRSTIARLLSMSPWLKMAYHHFLVFDQWKVGKVEMLPFKGNTSECAYITSPHIK